MLPLFSDDAARVTGFARRAEVLGFDGVFGFDHLLPLLQPPDRPSFEVYASLAAVAAATSTITVGTLVTRASLRPVGLLAKLAASVDDLSGGRFALAVGTGDELSKREHGAFGIAYRERAVRYRHLADTVLALRGLLRGEAWQGSDLVPAVDGPLLPAPHRPGGPPIWVGGLSDAVVATAGRLADAWNGWGVGPEGFARRAERLRAVAEETGRVVAPTWGGIALVGEDPADTARLRERRGPGDLGSDVWTGDVGELIGFLSRLEEVGAAWGILLLAGPADRLDLVAERVLPSLRGAA
jgi:alkanesulfonate monooxygenase SsuD/methylene tetrahydromethanopterin reductase-like flavin-dependent oxidoreductase (luciferase family)